MTHLIVDLVRRQWLAIAGLVGVAALLTQMASPNSRSVLRLAYGGWALMYFAFAQLDRREVAHQPISRREHWLAKAIVATVGGAVLVSAGSLVGYIFANSVGVPALRLEGVVIALLIGGLFPGALCGLRTAFELLDIGPIGRLAGYGVAVMIPSVLGIQMPPTFAQWGPADVALLAATAALTIAAFTRRPDVVERIGVRSIDEVIDEAPFSRTKIDRHLLGPFGLLIVRAAATAAAAPLIVAAALTVAWPIIGLFEHTTLRATLASLSNPLAERSMAHLIMLTIVVSEIGRADRGSSLVALRALPITLGTLLTLTLCLDLVQAGLVWAVLVAIARAAGDTGPLPIAVLGVLFALNVATSAARLSFRHNSPVVPIVVASFGAGFATFLLTRIGIAPSTLVWGLVLLATLSTVLHHRMLSRGTRAYRASPSERTS